ncbi:MAG: phasin family protein, partial [Pseudomonadota bacterium]
GFDYFRDAADDGVAVTQELMSLTDPAKAVDIQMAYATKAGDKASVAAAALSAKLQDVMGAASAPLAKRAEVVMTLAAEAFPKA